MKYCILLYFLILCVSVNAQNRTYNLPDSLSTDDYASNIIILKISSSSFDNARNIHGSSNDLKRILDEANINTLSAKNALPQLAASNTKARSSSSNSLSNIYKIEVATGTDIIEAINKLLQNENVIYAEPYFSHHLLHVPNDPESVPSKGKQNYLEIIKAYDAWSIEKGNPDIAIGILDTGIDLYHPDLESKIKINDADPINGIDDDGDGYVDNYYGWDIANNDNIPAADTDIHGIVVAGVAGAATNNNTGIAGVGYNSSILPIKIFKSGSNSFYNGYEGIALAANMGCKVINLSWGDAGGYSSYAQDIINYAVEEKDAAIVAAAGNTSAHLDFYPASYKNVLSVTATTLSDEKTAWSTYSYNVDISAPGNAIFSTSKNEGYTYSQGTSLSAPIVAGALALVRSRFPELTAQQAMEKVRVTADDIYGIGSNSNYFGALGKGRLNILNAITDIESPSLRTQNITYSNGHGAYIFHGDTISITTEIKNFLAASASDMNVSISSNSPYVEIINPSFKIGALGTFKTANNSSEPFKVIMSEDLPIDHQITFRIDYRSTGYNDFEYFTLKSNADYINFKGGSTQLTLASNGNLAYAEDGFRNGIGYQFENQLLLDNLGLIISTDSVTISDNISNSLTLNVRDNDFTKASNIKFYRNSIASCDARHSFMTNDGLIIEQKNLGWENEDYIVIEYRLINNGTKHLDEVKMAILADFNLNEKNNNSAHWEDGIGYVMDNESNNLFAGITVIKGENLIFNALDNKNYNGNDRDIPSILYDEIKYKIISNGIQNLSAGDQGTGNDVSMINGASINALNAKSYAKIIFVISAAHSLEQLKENIADAEQRYHQYLESPPLSHIAYTCKGNTVEVKPSTDEAMYDFYEDAALTKYISSGASIISDTVNEPISYYVVRKDLGYDSDIERVVAAPKLLSANFLMDSAPLLIDENNNTKVQFEDYSKDAIRWRWDFGNGYQGHSQNPFMHYPKPGNYTIELEVTNDLGCVEKVRKELLVANRSLKPEIKDQYICENDPITLTATNTNKINVYSNALLTEMVFTGNSFTSAPITSDTTFYVTSMDSLYESNPQPVHITTSKVKANFEISIDTTQLDSNVVLLTNTSEKENFAQWYINDIFSSESKNIEFALDADSSYSIKLIAQDAMGCFNIKQETITPSESITPLANDIEVCKNEGATISPTNGKLFFYYADSSLNQILHKGKCLMLSDVNEARSIYVTNFDQWKESTPVKINITLSTANAAFNAYVIDQSINIENNSTGRLTSYTWLLDGDTVSIEKDPIIMLHGEASLELMVTDYLGCEDSDVIQINNISQTVTGISSIEMNLEIFPNPVHDKLSFSMPVYAELMDSSGKIIRKKDEDLLYLEFSDLASGIYTLRTQENKRWKYHKIVKN